MPCVDDILKVTTGGRQGCRFGAKLFNLAYARALKEVHEKLLHKSIFLRLRSGDGKVHDPPGGWGLSSPSVHVDSHVIDATFVDGEAFMLCAAGPATLNSHINEVISALDQVFERFKMKITWTRGKSELMIAYRGRGVKTHKEALQSETGDLMYYDLSCSARSDRVQATRLHNFKLWPYGPGSQVSRFIRNVFCRATCGQDVCIE